MVTKIALIESSKFIESNYHELTKGEFADIIHRNTPYKRLFAFENMVTGYLFDYVFNDEVEFESWFVFVPNEITKLQCVEQLRIDNKYSDLMTALKLDATGWDMIRWEAASTLARDSQMVANLAGAFGMSSEDVDTFFVNASKILL